MRFIILYGIYSVITFASVLQAESIDMALSNKVQYCEVVAEIRVERSSIQTNWGLSIPIPECVCECTVIQLFKGPKELKTLTIRIILEQNKSFTYDSKTFVAFIINPRGDYRPLGAQGGLIEKGHTYFDPSLLNGIQYNELIKEIQELTKIRQRTSKSSLSPGNPAQADLPRSRGRI